MVPSMKVAVLVDHESPAAWEARAIEAILALGSTELVAVLVRIGDRIGVPSASPRSVGATAYRTFTRRISRSRALRRVAGPWSTGTPVLRITPARADGRLRIKPTDLDWLRARRPDVILALGFDGLDGDVLDVAPHGAWAFRFGTGASGPQRPVGFWETVDGAPVVRVTLERVASGTTPPTVLRRGWFAVATASHAKTRDRALLGAAPWPAHVMARVIAGQEVIRSADDAARDARGIPETSSFVRFASVTTKAFAQKLWHHGMRHDDWNIGIAGTAARALTGRTDIGTVDWAPTLTGHYAADPFGAWESDTLHVFYEDYAHASGVASIAHRTWSASAGWGAPTVALDIGTHLSYPFLLRRPDGWLLMPESRASGALTIYRAATLAGPWEPTATVNVDPDVADATLLEHGGRWWLFAIRPDRLNPATELALWYADTPEGPWTPHPANPVVVDVRCARPAGPFFEADGQLIRPAQDCSTGYGDRLTLRRVVTLTPERYEEETVGTLQPERGGAFPYGLHTLTEVGDRVLIDGKRRVWDTAALIRAVRGRLPI